MSTDLRDRLTAALRTAMRERDHVTRDAVRSALAAVANAEAAPIETLPRAGAVEGAALGVGAADAPRLQLSPEQVRAVVAGEVAEREHAAETYAAQGLLERAAELRAGAAALTRVLGDEG